MLGGDREDVSRFLTRRWFWIRVDKNPELLHHDERSVLLSLMVKADG